MNILPNEIAFDIDGVFADTFRAFVSRARKEYGYQFHYEDITEYEFRNVIDIDEQVSEEIIRSLVDYPIENGIRPIVGAVDVLTRLSHSGPIFFVTARTEKDAILEWIYHQLPGVDIDCISLETTNTHEEKLPVLIKNRVKYFVDDRLDTCYLLEDFSIIPIVFEQPWNRKPHSFTVVKTWDEISGMIEW
ncbi:MAG: haloacid dehalogenase [Thermodesulfobacteriota bacterium]|nr:haloacid dehalogenase [Thermodesulfobacteriota bacterium]